MRKSYLIILYHINTAKSQIFFTELFSNEQLAIGGWQSVLKICHATRQGKVSACELSKDPTTLQTVIDLDVQNSNKCDIIIIKSKIIREVGF